MLGPTWCYVGIGPRGDWRTADVDSDRFAEIALESDVAYAYQNVILEARTLRRRLHFDGEKVFVLDFVEDCQA